MIVWIILITASKEQDTCNVMIYQSMAKLQIKIEDSCNKTMAIIERIGTLPQSNESCDSTSTILKGNSFRDIKKALPGSCCIGPFCFAVSHATSDVETVYRQRRSFCTPLHGDREQIFLSLLNTKTNFSFSAFI